MGDYMQRNSDYSLTYPTLSEGEPIDQFLQSGSLGVTDFFPPSLLDHDFYAPIFSLDVPLEFNNFNSAATPKR